MKQEWLAENWHQSPWMKRLRRVLGIMLDEHEFLGSYGIRSLSRFHADHPYIFM